MQRRVIRLSQLTIDLTVLAAAFVLAFLMRFDWRPPTDYLGRLALTTPYIVVGEYCVLWLFGVTKFSWRYIGLRELGVILAAVLSGSVVILWSRVALGALQVEYTYLRHGVIPLGVIAGNFVLSFLGVTGVRVLRRLVGERAESRLRADTPAARSAASTMLVGAGRGGVLMSRELANRPDLGLRPVGFLDDDPHKLGQVIDGVPVLGTTEQLPELCRRHQAQQVLITMSSAPGSEIRRIAGLAEKVGVPVKIIPGLYEIADGRVELARIRPVAIEDLLRREPVELDADAISRHLREQIVLVTGAGGSIGSELCRQVAAFRPTRLLLVERAENSLFHIHRELKRTHPELDLIPLVADVTDRERMEEIVRGSPPHTVFHAAAHKHVPMMEWNPSEAIKNNVSGTKVVADLADAYGAHAFVMISTDKAVNPTSVMGTSKRIAEKYCQALSSQSQTRFVTVRFGNVLGSAGSVIPIFKEQIERGGPVTVTHPEMQRYFMTIPEACQLVLQASSMGAGGEIFILDMGAPVRIVDLARDLIQLSGFRPDDDIEIQFTGMRPGEKLFEELSVDDENAAKTRHPKIFVGRRAPAQWQEVMQDLSVLEQALTGGDQQELLAALRHCVPEYTPEQPAQTAKEAAPSREGDTSALTLAPS